MQPEDGDKPVEMQSQADQEQKKQQKKRRKKCII